MLKSTIEISRQDSLVRNVLVLFALLTVWWIVLQYIGFGQESGLRDLAWAASYQLVALYGGIAGLIIAYKEWGGMRSVVGSAIVAFSFGLLLQVLGQSTFSFYNLVLNVEIPYPSFADIGFFGSIPLYIYGAVQLARASGAAFSLRTYMNKLWAIAIPVLLLILSYTSFLRHYELDWSSPLRVFLDFAYPFGQAIYVSLAILAYLLSRGMLGGTMRNKVLFLLIALVVQYLADYNFLYQTISETWQNGGYGDFIYLFAYLLMAIGVMQIRRRNLQPMEQSNA